MGLFTWFRKKNVIEEKEEKYSFDNQDRELSLELRKTNSELRKTKKEIEIAEARLRLQELKDALSDYEGDEEDEEMPTSFESALAPYVPQLIPAVVKFLNGKGSIPQNAGVIQSSEPSSQVISLSQEQIDDMYKELPKNVKRIAKSLTDEQIKSYITQRIGVVSDDTIRLIIARVRT
jgi:hypothetical protein